MLLYIAASAVGLFLWIGYLMGNASFVPSSSSPPGEAQAQQRARCGELSPLRCRYHTACKADDENGCYRFALALELGQGGPIDLPGAVTHYEKACTMRSAPACHVLANLHHNGHGVPRDAVRAAALYAEACRLGMGSSCTGAAP